MPDARYTPSPAPKWSIPPGHVGNLNEQQQAMLDQLRKELVDEGAFVEDRMHDAMLLRFLRARKWNLALAKAMLLKAEEWRRKFDVDELMNEQDSSDQATANRIYPQYYHKTDKDGRPVYIERLGQISPEVLKNISDAQEDRQLRSLVREYEKMLTERLPACSEAIGHPVETSCTIMDLKDVSIGSFWVVRGYVQKAANISQNYYPETMGKFYIINAPWAFSMAWNVIKGWLDPVTVAKISIIHTSGQKELFAQIPVENLPKDLGGACACAENCQFSDSGPWKKENSVIEANSLSPSASNV